MPDLVSPTNENCRFSSARRWRFFFLWRVDARDDGLPRQRARAERAAALKKRWDKTGRGARRRATIYDVA